MVRDLLRYRALVRNLVLKELTLKYRDSVLGVAWSLGHPALLPLGVFLPVVALVSGAGLRWTAVLLLPVLLLHLLFTIGIALLLAAVTTAWRDVAHFTEVALVLVFWLTPIVY